jgi:predicted Zn-dependent peptidase
VTTARLDADQPVGSTRTLLEAAEGGLVRRSMVRGGLRVITEAMPGVRSASLGIWVGVGSRDESPSLAGASHFLEHLLFKGTATRSALEISESLEAVGGEMNAFTGKEYTCYHARVLDEDLPLAIDTMADMVTGSLIAADDVESEREVILEEIAMNDDDPDDVVHNLIATQVWGDTPLGRPIAGPPESIRTLTRTQVAGFYRRRYRAPAMVVSVAGNVDHDAVVTTVAKAFDRGGFLDGEGPGPAPLRPSSRRHRFRAAPASCTARPSRPTWCSRCPGSSAATSAATPPGCCRPRSAAACRRGLFQEVREKRGLAYSVYSFAASHADAGLFGVYAGCAPAKVDAVLTLVREQLVRVAERGLSAEELERGKGQMRGGTVLGLEDSGSRMSRIGKSDLLHGELASIDEVLSRIEAVTLDDVNELAAEFLGHLPSLAVVGPFDDTGPFSAAVA